MAAKDNLHLPATPKTMKEWGRRFHEMLETVALITIILDREGRIVFANNFLLDLTGWTMPEIAGRSWIELFIPQRLRDAVQLVFEAAIRGSEMVIHYENEIVTRHGEERLIRWSNTWLSDAAGEIEGTASIGEDITDRKRAEEKVSAYQERLRSLTAQLAVTEERERMRLATVLHEGVAQSLALANMKINLLARGELSPDSRMVLAELSENIGESIARIRESMVALSPPAFAFTDVKSGIEWLLDTATKAHPGVRFTLEDDGAAKPVEGSMRALLVSAARELVANALAHGKARIVVVMLKRKEEHVEMTVRDDGVGFDVATLGVNFDATGGFGLFNLRERLVFNGGRFRIDSEPGCGTSATVLVPLK